MIITIAGILPEFCRNLPEFAGICRNLPEFE
jgi:hypothetical protein